MSSEEPDPTIAAEVNAKASPVYWPLLSAREAADEWPRLREWVEELQRRFPHTLRLPACWWQHNDLVETLSALRDQERGAYADSASPGSATEWHRAFRELETRMESWIKRFGCNVPGREHPIGTDESAWEAFVADDIAHRDDTPRTAEDS